MARVNENFLKLNGGYLFPEVARRTRALRFLGWESEIRQRR